MAAKLVLLIANETSATNQKKQEEVKQVCRGWKLDWEEVDGTLEENRELRSKLWDISGKKAEWPQAFALKDDGEYVFLGDHELIQKVNEMTSYIKENPEVREANPDAKTFDEVFELVMPQ
mmetsp:Transcript_159512/g.281565  ORF Transcript_159512/g.281565 Transcript_159512/m.281565 type:complete len:120 (+) Transcript_159512:54-413(+)